jgi:hypothetical protein
MIVVCVFLSGCASSLNTQENITIALSRCPVLKNYSKEKLQRVAATVNNLPDDSELIEILGDYSRLREACRAAERKLKNSR